MIPTLSQVCSLTTPFAHDAEDYAAGHCHSVEIWFTKLEDYLKQHRVQEVLRLWDDLGIRSTVASFQGGLWPVRAKRVAPLGNCSSIV
jgi:hypothetical protein